MIPEHALDRTARLINSDLFAGEVSTDQIIDGLEATTILLRADEANLSSPTGQTALCALFGQIAMMGIGIDLDVPDVPILVPQPPLRGDRLRSALLDYASDLIPGMRCGREIGDYDLSLVLGDTATGDYVPFALPEMTGLVPSGRPTTSLLGDGPATGLSGPYVLLRLQHRRRSGLLCSESRLPPGIS